MAQTSERNPPAFRYRLPLPKLLEFSRCEGNVKTIERILYVPASKDAIALVVSFYEILRTLEEGVQECKMGHEDLENSQ